MSKDSHYTEEEILQYLQENGMIALDTIQCEMEMAERKKYLDIHPYKIWKGSDGNYVTYFPDENAKEGRIRRKRKNKKDLENLIIKYWRDKEEFISVEDVFNEWNDRRLQLKQIAQSTYDRNKRIFKRHFSELGKQDIKKISDRVISDFLEEQIPKYDMTPKAFSNLKGIVKGMFKRAKRQELIDFSVEQMLQELDLSENCFKRICKEDQDQIFDEEEFTTLASYLKEHPDIWNLGIMLILATGLRVGELVALKWSDFPTADYTHFKVQRTETSYKVNGKTVYDVRVPKTAAGNRTVTIPDECIWILKELRKINPFGEYIFMKNGTRMTTNSIRDRLYRICDKLGFKRKSPHKGRKTYASILCDRHVDNAFIISQLGHTDISCTETFYHKDRKSNATKSAIVNSIPEFSILAK